MRNYSNSLEGINFFVLGGVAKFFSWIWRSGGKVSIKRRKKIGEEKLEKYLLSKYSFPEL